MKRPENGNYWLTVRYAFQARRWQAAGLILLTLFGGVLPNALILAVGLLVSTVSDLDKVRTESLSALSFSLGLLGTLFLLQQTLEPVRRSLTTALSSHLDQFIRTRVLDATLGPRGISHLEDPETADGISRAQGIGIGWHTPGQAIASLAGIATHRVRSAIAAIILLTFNLWLPLVLIGIWLFTRTWLKREIRDLLAQRYKVITPLRRSSYFRQLALQPAAAKEIRVFGLPDWVIDRFSELWTSGIFESWRQRRQHRPWTLGSFLLLLIGHSIALGLLGNAALQHQISLASLVVYVQAVLAMNGFGFAGDDEWRFEEASAPLRHTNNLSATLSNIADVPVGTEKPPPLASGSITLDQVSFRYPTSQNDVLDHLNLTIPIGQSLAIVGENGVGKTTLVKLLLRLYEPTDGKIEVLGRDLSNLDLRLWRRNIAVTFQDFGHYEFTVRENIDLRLTTPSSPASPDAIRAAQLAGADSIISSLPRGWETVLSRAYEDGVDLSGGEWQRVALARCLFAMESGAHIMILDEPTANLDIRGEAEVFNRLLDVTAGRTLILISHRFSTVRRADRICVLKDGGVHEIGSHEELMAARGLYARMFELQAQAFQDVHEE